MKKIIFALCIVFFSSSVFAQEKESLVGTLKVFEDGSKGVVFHDFGNGHGIAVSIDEVEVCWYASNTNNTMKFIILIIF